MSILRTFGKIKKRVVAVLLVPVCVLSFGYCNYDTAMAAAEEAIAAEAFELVPLTWDMFATIMTALGVGTATYWAGKNVADRKITLEEITERLVPEVGWFHQEVADFRDHDIPEYIEGVGGWLKMMIGDGLSFLSENVLRVFTDFAAEKGWLGGVSAPSVSFPASNPFVQGTIESVSVNNEAFFALLKAKASSVRYDAVQRLVSQSYSSGYYLVCNNITGAGMYFCAYPIATLIGLRAGGPQTADHYWHVYVNSVPRIAYQCSISSTGEVSSESYNAQLLNNNLYCPRDMDSYYVSNYGAMSTLQGNDVPIGENGQVVDNDGAIDYPWPQHWPLDVDGATSYPVTIPDALAPDVIITQPDISVPVSLPRVTDMPGVFDRDLPRDTTQEETQEGTVDVPQDLPVESPVYPTSSNLFFLPDWIKERFPFCIPFDLKRGADLFRTAGDTPPKWTFTLHYGLRAEKSYTIDVDMSRFNDLMSVFRVGELLLFILGLALVTRSILRS